MRTFNWERLGGVMGILFAILLAITVFSTGQPPDPDDPVAKYVAYYHDHRNAFLVSALVGSFAFIAGLWFLGALRSVLRRAEGPSGGLSTLALVAFAPAATLAAVGGAMQTAAAFKLAGIDGSGLVVRALSDAGFATFGSIGAPLSVGIGAASLAAARSRVLPSWLVILGLVIALLEVVSLFAVLNSSPLGLLAPIGLVVWSFATGAVLLARGRKLFPATEATSVIAER